ncbi:MAG: MFS transporter [Beijerinckiaceae bacterium]|nr:MFS transporter [Beijerinckiaceae bacterium]
MPPVVRRAILGLGISQIIGWGTTYYLLSLLSGEIGASLGLSTAWVLGGTSLTLAAAALIGPRIGRWQDRAGSRIVMATGTVIMAAGLVVLAFSKGLFSYYLGWAIIGVGSPMTLYSAAFTALTQMSGPQARRAISYLTFMGGLASTSFWPLTAWLMSFLDWRTIILLFAALNIAICLPIHLTLLNREGAGHALLPAADPVEAGIPATAFPVAFALFAAMLAMNGLIFNSWSLLVFPLLEGLGFATKAAVLVGSMVGVFQVAGRMGEALLAQRYSIMWTAFASAAFLPVSFFILVQADASMPTGLLFAAFYGISNGLMTIARGGLTLAIFGSRGYGERLNRITVSQNAAGAVAPILGGFLLDRLGAVILVDLMLGTSALALVTMLALRHHCSRHGLN